MSNKKTNHKALVHARRNRRRMRTFVRMLRYGVNNFSRNAWLTLAAIAVMSVTLLIIFMTLASRQVLLDTVAAISKQTEISIYLKGSTKQEVVDGMMSRISGLDNVDSVRFISADEARKEQAERFKDDPEALEAIKESSNQMAATIRVSLQDLNDYRSLENFIKTDEDYKEHKDTRQKPSFIGFRRQAIENIGEWVKLASIGGSIATGVFVIISSLVVFNTIRMAIFNRRDEIQMMKLIGADKGFIRGPFVVEAIMYGFTAAIISTAVGYGLLFMAREPLNSYDIPMDQLMNILTIYIGFVATAMILVGSLIGIISSWIATRRYLKL